ncbi:MAG TPA: efflux transporter outer membrane subunit [Vicinamibacterales bacterium]|jgi:NodT family efflux transporter outer membrane factor (OMF) lipoprotein
MIRRLVPALLAVVATGCAVGPNYTRPAAPTAPAFKEAPPEGWKEAQPNEGIPRGRWWELYNDAQLNALESEVEVSNQNVIAAMARYREARDQVRIARASLFPTVSATPSITVVHGSSTFTRGTGLSTTASSTSPVVAGPGSIVDYTMPVDVSYQADVWGSIRRSVTANAASAQASAADLENAKLTYQSQLAEMYFELHGLDGDADLLQRTVTLYQQSLQLTQDRFDAGIASGADVAQAKTQLASTRSQLIDVGVARAQFEHAIATLMGQAPASVSVPVAVLTAPPPVIPIGVPSTLMERRPDVTATERAVAAANEQIGIAKAAFFPLLTLSATGGFESTSLAQWFTLPSRFWSVGPQLAATLFDGGKRHAQTDLSEAAYDESVANYRQTVLTAFQQVEDQLSSLRILEQEAAVETEAVEAAQQSLEIVTLQYTAGTTDYLQVITSQTAALQAQRQAIDILTRRLTASVLLIEALGGGWDASQLPSQ